MTNEAEGFTEGAKRRKGEGGGGGHPLPLVGGPGGLPLEILGNLHQNGAF